MSIGEAILSVGCGRAVHLRGCLKHTVMLPLSELKRHRPGPDPRLYCLGLDRTLDTCKLHVETRSFQIL